MSFPLDERKVDSWKSLRSEGVEGIEQVSKKSENKLFFNTNVQKHHTQPYFLKILLSLCYSSAQKSSTDSIIIYRMKSKFLVHKNQLHLSYPLCSRGTDFVPSTLTTWDTVGMAKKISSLLGLTFNRGDDDQVEK